MNLVRDGKLLWSSQVQYDAFFRVVNAVAGTEATRIVTSEVPAHVMAITTGNIAEWNTAFGWGDHALAGYLTSFTETDPVFAASAAAGIAGLDITNWNAAFSWGNHALAGYLTSFTEADPVFTASAAAGIAGADITNWNTAFGWGDHAAGGYAQDSVVVKLSGDQTVAGVKTLSSAPRVHSSTADMIEWWRTSATANQGRWLWQLGSDGKMFLIGLTDAGAAGQLALDIPRSAGNVPAVNLYANGVVNLATQQYNTGDNTSGAVVRHRNGGFYDVGMNVMPITDLTGADLTLGPQHCGGLIRKWDTVARNINIPASTDTTIPIGARFEYAGWNPGVVTLVGGAGVSISWMSGAGTVTGNRSFASGSAVTIVRTDAARWFVWGTGIS